jgi:hypothetical protein
MLLNLLITGASLFLPPQKSLPASRPADRGSTTPITAIAVHTRQAPVIDGRNDDPIWASAPKIGDFRQFAPHVNGDPTFRTEFQSSNDEHNL